MIGKSVFAYSLLVPVLALTSGPSLNSTASDGSTDLLVPVEMLDVESSADGSTCSFAIRATNNLSFDVWVDLYVSTVKTGTNLLNSYKQMKIQNHRIATGKSMDRRYTASRGCSAARSWRVKVRIPRPDGRKIYKTVYRSTKGSGSRTVNLGKSSTWGL